MDLNLDALIGLSWEEAREGKPSPFFFDKDKVEAFVRQIREASRKNRRQQVGQVRAPFPLHFRGCEKANEKKSSEYAKICIRICHECGCGKLIIPSAL